MYHGSKFTGMRYVFDNMFNRPGQCPYWIGHRYIKGRILGDLLFDKWNKRPNTAYKLYWYLHPEEYAKANNLLKSKKKKND